MTKKIVKKGAKEALNISTRAVNGVAADIAKESLKDELKRTRLTKIRKDALSADNRRCINPPTLFKLSAFPFGRLL